MITFPGGGIISPIQYVTVEEGTTQYICFQGIQHIWYNGNFGENGHCRV